MVLQPLLDQLQYIKEMGLTGGGVVARFLHHLVQPLMQKEHLGFEYTGPNNCSRIKPGVKPSKEELERRMKKVLGNVLVSLLRLRNTTLTTLLLW